MAAVPLVALMSDEYRPQLQHNESSDSNTTDDDILSMVYGFVEPEEHAEDHVQYEFITEESMQFCTVGWLSLRGRLRSALPPSSGCF